MQQRDARFLKDVEVAQLLGVSVATVQRWRMQGKDGPKYCRVGAGAIRYRPEDVAAYIESRLCGGTQLGIAA